ncbi:MAG: conserved exported protein of unknown function [Nitrospira sp.]|nr:MAG: conserved exported protein of unknown function [Nitrospira sp.]
MAQRRHSAHVSFTVLAAAVVMFYAGALPAIAQQNGDKAFHALVTDAKDMQTDLKNVLFYWEEKVSETSFIPHELKHLPVKRGTATVNIKFDGVKQLEVTPGADKALPTLHITLTNGKTGDFPLAIDGSFKGDSDFGQVELPVQGLKKLEFK